MKNLIIIIFTLLQLLTYGQKNKPIGQWKLIAIKNIQTNQLDTSLKHEKGLTISFSADTIFKGRLTVNSFSGIYQIKDAQIKITTGPITEICCDTKIARKFPDDLFHAEKFKINGDSLILTGPSNILYLFKKE